MTVYPPYVKKLKAYSNTTDSWRPRAALRSLEQAFSISYRYGLKDIRLASLPILADIYRCQGREEEAWRAKVHMLELRDSLRSYVVAEDLHQLELKRERRDMQARMAVAEYRAKEKDWWLAGITVFALVILFFLLRLRNRNQRLRQHSALLYERMRQLYASQPIPVSDLKGEKRATAIDADGIEGMPSAVTIDMTLTCTKGCYANTLLFFFQNKNDDGTFTTFGNTRSEPIWLNQGDTAQYHFVVAMPEYKPRTNYRLLVNYKNAEGKNTFLCRQEFTTLSVTGIGDDASSFGVSIEAGKAHISAPCLVTALECYGIDGRRHSVRWQPTGNGAEADLGTLARGIYLLRCTLADGTTHACKVKN